MKYNPHAYQRRAIDFVESHDACALFMGMGLGKSSVVLTALDELKYDRCDVGKVLVVAPKSVALNTWTGECAKWDHLQDTVVSVVIGTAKQRSLALEADADIWVINRENVPWLVDRYFDAKRMKFTEPWPFDTVVLDESSSFKDHRSKRYRAMLRVRPYVRRLVLLTGTPAPNGLMDLWAQVRLLDGGERLGRFIGLYRDQWFRPGAHNGSVVYEYVPKHGAKEQIAERISDICLSMQASDYLSMPAVIDGGMTLQLDRIAAYRKFEKDCVMDAADGTEILAVTAVALTNKLLQFASGAVYDDAHLWHEVSDTKLDALTELLEQTDEPVLVYYNYRHELERILKEVPDAVPFRGEPDILSRWNDGEVKVMLAHPASVAFGLNMQRGGHIIVWYSPTWNLELYQQANARLNRQGQTKPVVIYHLVCKDTMDEVVMDALSGKEDTQTALMRHIKQLSEKYNG